jgi:hypothetical protein
LERDLPLHVIFSLLQYLLQCYDPVIMKNILGSFASVRPALTRNSWTFISSFKHWPMSLGQGLKFCPTSRRQVHNLLSSNYDALQTVEVEYAQAGETRDICISAVVRERAEY